MSEHAIDFKIKMLPDDALTLLKFLRLIQGPEFTYIHVLDPKAREELAQGFADDVIGNPLFSGSLEVLSFYNTGMTLVVNVRRIQ